MGNDLPDALRGRRSLFPFIGWIDLTIFEAFALGVANPLGAQALVFRWGSLCFVMMTREERRS